MTEPSPHRDPGPYESADQARAQLRAAVFGIPDAHAAPGFAGEMALMEALFLAGVQVSAWEDVERAAIARTLPPEVVQVIAGWLLRARLAAERPDPSAWNLALEQSMRLARTLTPEQIEDVITGRAGLKVVPTDAS